MVMKLSGGRYLRAERTSATQGWSSTKSSQRVILRGMLGEAPLQIEAGGLEDGNSRLSSRNGLGTDNKGASNLSHIQEGDHVTP